MIRYMICPIIGDGTFNNQFRASVASVQGVLSSTIIPTFANGPNHGHPKYLFAFCIVSTDVISKLTGVTNSYVFPDYNLDGRMDGMESGARSDMVQSAQAFNLDGAGLHLNATHVDADSYRYVIDSLGKQFDQAFQVNNFGVAEVGA